MSDFRHDVITVLAGGLPGLLDGVPPPAAAAPPPTIRVEETPPSGTFRDREPFLMNVSSNQILIGAAGLIGILAIIMIARR